MNKPLTVWMTGCMITMVTLLNAQVKPSPRHVDLIRQKEAENLTVLQQWIRWNNPGSLLINHLNQQAFDLYAARDKEIAKLTTREDWTARQKSVMEKLRELAGPFPEKTPLKPRILGTIQKKGYKVEKIVYESMPGFYVTGCLFIPDVLKGKAPAVLNLIGHEQESFKAELDQLIILNLVKKGMVVFSIDPLGQGEHVQYYDSTLKVSSIGYSVIEHCYFGNQTFLSGVSGARYFIWDGIRAIDYLVSRKEVDPKRIGVTGFSGGGNVTAYLGALDNRVKVAIPSSWSTASRRQLESKGAQDAETELVGAARDGITFEDLIEARAPQPTMMTFVSRDEYLCLQGAREAYAEAMNAYRSFNTDDNLQLVEDDSKHWLTPKIRLALYSFFMKHFNLAGDATEQEIEPLKAEELKITPTGQISTSLGGDMIFDVNKKEVSVLIGSLSRERMDVEQHLRSVSTRAKEISGFAAPEQKVAESFINGRYQRDGYTVGKYAIRGEGEYVIPLLLFVPDTGTGKHPAVAYFHAKGKITEAGPGGEIEKLVRKGYIVAAADVLGSGETANTATRSIAPGYTAVLIGRSVVAIQAGDMIRVMNFLKSRNDVDPGKIGGVGTDGLCIPLIHAAAFDPSINNVVLKGSLVSYRSVAMNRFFKIGLIPNEGGGTWHPNEVDFSWGVAGVLKGYDLPDLIGCIAPRKVVIEDPKDQMLGSATPSLIQEEMEFPRSAYSFKKVPGNLRVETNTSELTGLLEWSFKD